MRRVGGRLLQGALGLMAQAGCALAQATLGGPQSFAVTFEACLTTIDQYAAHIGVSPEIMVQTANLFSVRFFVRDAIVVVTCSRPSNTMTVTLFRSECEPGGLC